MKKFIPFILILSLLVCFIPSYNFVVYAADSVSDDDVNGGGGGHSRNNHYTGLLGTINQFLIDHGFVINDENVITFNVIDSILEDNFDVDLDDYISIYDKNVPSDLPFIYDNFSENIVDFDFDSFADFLKNYTLNYSNDNIPYYIYQAMPVSNFFNFFSFVNDWNQGNYPTLKSNLIDKVNSLDSLCAFTISGTSITRHPTYLVSISQNMIDNYYFYKRSGVFWDFPELLYQSYVNQVGIDALPTPPSDALSGRLSFSDGISEYQGSLFYYGNGPLLNQTELSSMTDFYNYLFCGCYNDFKTNGDWGHFSGTCYLVPDSWGDFKFLVFKDNAYLFAFISGNSNVYKFNPTVDLSQYGQDIDYSKLYDIISGSISGSSGNVIDAIDNVANNYLQQQLDLLHDINNALNDGSGQSWLRRIYGILDYNFPLTLNAFEELINAVQNISVSGGGDFSEATQVLHEIDTKLGILIDQPFIDLTDNDWNDMKSRIQTKFPFCIFSDIVAISVILNRPPQQPDLNFPIPIMGSESDNMVHIDLSPYEHARPYVHGALIFLFIIGLLALSVKIFDHLKS